jgi:hypothetical protein
MKQGLTRSGRSAQFIAETQDKFSKKRLLDLALSLRGSVTKRPTDQKMGVPRTIRL